MGSLIKISSMSIHYGLSKHQTLDLLLTRSICNLQFALRAARVGFHFRCHATGSCTSFQTPEKQLWCGRPKPRLEGTQPWAMFQIRVGKLRGSPARHKEETMRKIIAILVAAALASASVNAVARSKKGREGADDGMKKEQPKNSSEKK